MTRRLLYVFLMFSVLYAGVCVFYKIKYLGFNLSPLKKEDLWSIEAHISFEPIEGENIEISLTRPVTNSQYKVLEEDLVGDDFKQKRLENKIVLTSGPKDSLQDIYYKVLLFDNSFDKGKIWQEAPNPPAAPVIEEGKENIANKIYDLAEKQQGNLAEKLIKLLNEKPINPTVLTFLPTQKSDANTLDTLIALLHLKAVPARVLKGIKLEENSVTLSPSLMLEAYIDGAWRAYDIHSAKPGIPQDFVLFQRGGDGILDVKGGQNSGVKFSVIKSVSPSFLLAEKRSSLLGDELFFNYSLYKLPVATQNILKWLSIFPLAILIVVIMRNIIGIPTMGTFTPMLISLSLVKTGFFAGILMFAVMICVGLLLRSMLTRFNLLLVPRISAVVIFVILAMQFFAIAGHNFDLKLIESAVFFPIIIMAWIIERASITWEEDGAKNALREIFNSIFVAIITYFVVVNDGVRHVMYAFNELNLVVLAVVMLLGTYTGYRITELFRFKSLVSK